MLSKWFITVDADLGHLAEVVFVQLLNHKVQLLFSFPCCSLWKEVTTCCPHERTWDWCSRSLRVSTQIFQNSFALKICPLSPIYLLQLIIYITRIHLLLPLIITQWHFTYVLLKLMSLGHWEFFLWAPMFLWHTSIIGGGFVVFSGALPYFLAIQGVLQIHYIYFLLQS